MKIAIGSDHRGDEAARSLVESLRRNGHEPIVVGPCDGQSRDYPDEAYLVARAVTGGAADRGVLICGSGNGICIAANKVDGARAAIGYSIEAAEMARRHNDANIICFSGDHTDHRVIARAVDAFLRAEFEGGRHARRVKKIQAIESGRDPADVTESAPST